MGAKVLHVFATFGKGGPQVRSAALMGRFPRGTTHFLVAMDGNTEALSLVPRGVTIQVLPPPGEKGFFKTSKAMAGLFRKVRPDLLLTYNWGAVESLAGAMAAGIGKVVHHEEGFGPGEAEGTFLRRNLARRFLFQGASALVVPSRVLQRLARRKWKVPEEKLHYLPNGVDLERFHPAESEAAGPLKVGFLGGFRPEKAPEVLVRVFRRASLPPEARLLLAGGGPEEENLRREVRRLGLEERVEFRGNLEDPAPFYREIHVFLLSSRTEQMPLVVLEAMASGLPLVSTDVGDLGDMVSEENRPFLAPPGEEAALARHLAELAGDPELRKRIGRANRKVCREKFELEARLSAYMDLYLKVLEG